MGQRGFFAQSAAGLAAAALMLCAVPNAAAQTNSIFPKGWDSNVRDRLFMRMGYVSIIAKTKSEDVRDVNGAVVDADKLNEAADWGDANLTGSGDPLDPDFFDIDPFASYSLAVGAITPGMNKLGGSLGTPRGVKAKVKNASTLAFSIGYWLTDDHTWMVEGFVLANPMTIKAEGAGVRYDGRPNGIAGKEILTAKMLPPLVVLSYHFGDRQSLFRPYVGLAATYAVFYDAKATAALGEYVGGTTKVSIKNAGGFGGFLGVTSPVTDGWHVNLAVGKLKLKTEATLTTYNTSIKTGMAVLQDYSLDISKGVAKGEADIDSQMTTKLMQLYALRTTGDRNNLGTFVRKQKNSLDNTIVNLSVGRSF